MHVRRLDHVAVAATDPAATARWYEDTLGLQRRFVGVWGPGAPLMLGAGETCVALVRGDNRSLAHLAFEVSADDLARAERRLATAGVPFHRSDHGIAWSLYLSDPDGGEVELTAYKPEGGPVSQDPKSVVSAIVETMFNRHNLDAANTLVAPDVVDHSGFPGQPPGLEGMKQRWAMLFTAFPDFQIEIHDLVAEHDKVSMRATARGTHQGEFFGIPATGRAVVFTEINLSTISKGRMVEHWAERGTLEVMRQLGAIPS